MSFLIPFGPLKDICNPLFFIDRVSSTTLPCQVFLPGHHPHPDLLYWNFLKQQDIVELKCFVAHYRIFDCVKKLMFLVDKKEKNK